MVVKFFKSFYVYITTYLSDTQKYIIFLLCYSQDERKAMKEGNGFVKRKLYIFYEKKFLLRLIFWMMLQLLHSQRQNVLCWQMI